MKELLKNEIVINWIAPIITGLIVFIIPTASIKIWQNKKDEKEIKNANQRFLDAIMPFIIQKIEINKSLIEDVRKTIINESNIKDKYIYTEIDLRNKLILDISESKYIDEKNKDELISFTYKAFADIANKTTVHEKDNEEAKDKKNLYMIIFCVLMLIISQIFLFITIKLDTRDIKIEDNILLYLPLFSGLLSITGIMMIGTNALFGSKVYKNNRISGNIYNTYNDLLKTINKYNKKKKELSNKNNDK